MTSSSEVEALEFYGDKAPGTVYDNKNTFMLYIIHFKIKDFFLKND